MESSEHIKALHKYANKFRGVLSRFRDTQSGLYMCSEDNALVKQISIEVMDLIDERFGKNQYSQMIANAINEGRNNFHEMQSYRSIEETISVIESVITKIERNPEPPPAKPVVETSEELLAYPKRITYRWIKDHVPISLWSAFFGLLAAAFIAGITFAKSDLYNTIIQATTNKTPIENNESKNKK